MFVPVHAGRPLRSGSGAGPRVHDGFLPHSFPGSRPLDSSSCAGPAASRARMNVADAGVRRCRIRTSSHRHPNRRPDRHRRPCPGRTSHFPRTHQAVCRIAVVPRTPEPRSNAGGRTDRRGCRARQNNGAPASDDEFPPIWRDSAQAEHRGRIGAGDRHGASSVGRGGGCRCASNSAS